MWGAQAALASLLVASFISLAAAAWRLSGRLETNGLEQALSWAALTATVAVLESLLLGLVGLGGSPAALTAAAVATWVAARIGLPPAPRSPLSELVGWWRGLSLLSRAGAGATAGALGAVCLTLLHRPEPGFDGITYHLPEIVGFVQSGHPGSVLQTFYGLPVGNYPLTNEVLLSWFTGTSHGYAALTLWSPAAALLLVAGGWLALRELGVARAVRVLALAALMLGPYFVAALATPGTDLPALMWLILCAALCLAARRRTLLLAPAIVAFGLAIGTKTTVAPYGVVVLGFTLWTRRSKLRPIARPLLAATGAAVAVGAVWYLRNLIEHGSPLWPFYATPWGDPVPLLLRVLSVTMAERLHYTLIDNLSQYLTATAGSVVLLVGGVIVPGLARRRRVAIAAAVVAVGTIVWANAPATGLPTGGVLAAAVGSTVRYLMPVFTAGAVALALAATDGGRPIKVAAVLTLAGALGWAVQRDWNQGFFLPFSSWLAPATIAGAAAGALGSWRIDVVRRAARALSARAGVAVLSVGAALGAALILTAGSDGYIERHTAVRTELDAPALAFLASQPSFRSDHRPIASSPIGLGLLAGDRLQHRMTVLGEHQSCASIRVAATRGWVVLAVAHPVPVPGHPGVVFPSIGTAPACLAPLTPVFVGGNYRIYGPRP